MEAPTTSQPTPNAPRLIPLAEARAQLSPHDFRIKLRHAMLANPHLTLKKVATSLHISRQRVGLIVGRLNRPNCASNPAPRPAPKTEQAKQRMAELTQRVAQGESAEAAAAALGISLGQAYALGFRARGIKPAHGGGRKDCFCWRCKKAQGLVTPRGPRSGSVRREAVLDWLAWVDPDSNENLTQARIARLVGVAQPMVSRIARARAT